MDTELEKLISLQKDDLLIFCTKLGDRKLAKQLDRPRLNCSLIVT